MTSSPSSKPRTPINPSAKPSVPAACPLPQHPSPSQGCQVQGASMVTQEQHRWILGHCLHVHQQVGPASLPGVPTGAICRELGVVSVRASAHAVSGPWIPLQIIRQMPLCHCLPVHQQVGAASFSFHYHSFDSVPKLVAGRMTAWTHAVFKSAEGTSRAHVHIHGVHTCTYQQLNL
jgi:hypothetical protein